MNFAFTCDFNLDQVSQGCVPSGFEYFQELRPSLCRLWGKWSWLHRELVMAPNLSLFKKPLDNAVLLDMWFNSDFLTWIQKLELITSPFELLIIYDSDFVSNLFHYLIILTVIFFLSSFIIEIPLVSFFGLYSWEEFKFVFSVIFHQVVKSQVFTSALLFCGLYECFSQHLFVFHVLQVPNNIFRLPLDLYQYHNLLSGSHKNWDISKCLSQLWTAGNDQKIGIKSTKMGVKKSRCFLSWKMLNYVIVKNATFVGCNSTLVNQK